MNTIARNVIAVIAGIFVGGLVNMAIVMIGPSVVAPPPGVDMSNVESIAASIHLFEAKHFAFPFLAHALGTLTGAFAAFVIAGSRRTVFAYVIGLVNLAGGIMASLMIPAPAWFIALDLIVAYIPMAWLATLLGSRFTGAAADVPPAA